jgi:hypothetical protein
VVSLLAACVLAFGAGVMVALLALRGVLRWALRAGVIATALLVVVVLVAAAASPWWVLATLTGGAGVAAGRLAARGLTGPLRRRWRTDREGW